MLGEWVVGCGLVPEKPPSTPIGPPDERDAERITSAEILAQALWLYEQHERRVQNCQNMAVALLTIVGTILALSSTAIPEKPATWQLVALGLVAVAGLGTMTQCTRVLAPRVRANGLPSVDALRRFAHEHETLTAARTPIPVSQFAVDLLNPLRLGEPSPLSQASADANRRTAALAHAYWWLAATFVLVIATSTLFSLIE